MYDTYYCAKARDLGVTLIETLLVLAIVGTIVALSVKYYSTAQVAISLKDMMDKVTNITAGMDQLATPASGYLGIAAADLAGAVGKKGMYTSWNNTNNSDIAVTIASITPCAYTITLPSVPSYLCAALMRKLKGNTRITVASNCNVSGTQQLQYKYDNTVYP